MTEPFDIMDYARQIVAAALSDPASRASADDARRYLAELRESGQITRDEYVDLLVELAQEMMQ